MDLEVKWTKRAQLNLEYTASYIEKEWGSRSAQKFIRKVNRLLETLKKQPHIGKIAVKEKEIRAFVFSRQNKVFYRIRSNYIIILAIFDNRMDSKKHPK